MNNFSSKLVENVVNEFSKLPGIGRKTALRLALHLLKEEKSEVELLANGLLKMKDEVIFCKVCHNISDTDICNICANPRRDPSLICVVEDIRDVMAIENTSQFNGLYHVLGGIISPMDGVGPNDIKIKELVERIKAATFTRLSSPYRPPSKAIRQIFIFSGNSKILKFRCRQLRAVLLLAMNWNMPTK